MFRAFTYFYFASFYGMLLMDSIPHFQTYLNPVIPGIASTLPSHRIVMRTTGW